MTAMHDPVAPRRRRTWRWARLLLAAALLMPLVSSQTTVIPVRADDLSDAVQQQMALDKLLAAQKKQLATVKAQEAALKAQMAAAQKNLDGVAQSMDELQGEIDSLQFDVDQVHLSYDSLVSQEQSLQNELHSLDQTAQAKADLLAQRQQILAERIVAAYKTDQTPLLTQILTSGSLTDVLSDVSYYGDLGAQDEALAKQIVQDEIDLAKMRKQVEQAKADVDATALQVGVQKADLDSQMSDLNNAKGKLAALQRSINSQIAKQAAADAKLAKNKAALAAAIKANGDASAKLAKQIDKLAAQYGGKGRIPSAYNGKLSWPMGGKVSQEFGCTGFYSEPRVGNCAHFHQGIDIVAPCLTPVHAAGSGVVVFVGYNPYDPPPRAWLVIIAHSTTLVTWYAHMTGKAPAGIKVGAQVYAGEVIGTENTTGHSTGCHLHWAVLVSGVFMNPRLFI